MSKKVENFLHGIYAHAAKVDGDVFIYDHAGPRLFMRVPDSSKKSIAEISSGAIELALCVHGPVLFFLFRFADGLWADAPFNINLNSVEHQLLPSQNHDLQILYYDSTKEKILAERKVPLPDAFASQLRALVAAQNETPTSNDEFVKALYGAHAVYNEPWQMTGRPAASCRVDAIAESGLNT